MNSLGVRWGRVGTWSFIKISYKIQEFLFHSFVYVIYCIKHISMVLYALYLYNLQISIYPFWGIEPAFFNWCGKRLNKIWNQWNLDNQLISIFSLTWMSNRKITRNIAIIVNLASIILNGEIPFMWEIMELIYKCWGYF